MKVSKLSSAAVLAVAILAASGARADSPAAKPEKPFEPIAHAFSDYDMILLTGTSPAGSDGTSATSERHGDIARLEATDAPRLDHIVNLVKAVNAASEDALPADGGKRAACSKLKAIDGLYAQIEHTAASLDSPFAGGATTDLGPAIAAVGKYRAACAGSADSKDPTTSARGALVDLLGALDDLSLDAGTARAFLDASAMSLMIPLVPDATRSDAARDSKTTDGTAKTVPAAPLNVANLESLRGPAAHNGEASAR